ncbi:hypothetical protein ACO229_19945 [Promicromonospora sp. MS192]|uniref:hypothetical protein n=1 Tax=Promicromonospora sp. MS192 TaxID=3412684 RepID=UPI003C2CB61D
MTIRRMQWSGGTAGSTTRALVAVLGLGMTAALTLSGCAQSDVGGAGGSTSDASASETPQESDTPSPSPSESDGGGTLPDAAEMDTTPGTSGRGLPPGLEGSTDSTVGVAWSPEEGLLYVVTNGSSSCPTLAEPEATFGAGAKSDAVAAADGVLSVQLLPAEDGICTMDFVPTTTVVQVPAEADTGEEIPVMLGDKGKVELMPRPAAGEPGPVAWLES